MKKKKLTTIIFIITFSIIVSLFKSQVARAANSTASALATVIQAIGIAWVSDLQFGTGSPGDAAKVVAATAPEAASFTVTGEPTYPFTITLPTSVTMNHSSGGGTNKTILVNSFTSSPSGTGTIGAGGSTSLKVGATRAALGALQVVGTYSATFTVTVIY